MKPKVAVIIVVWNGIEDTLECLRSLASDRYLNKHLILVDNGSSDGSAERVREVWPAVDIVETGTNLGFTGGNNAGLIRASEIKADYAFLLNNDTTLEPGALSEMVQVAERELMGAIFAPVTHYYDVPEKIWFSGAVLCLGKGQAVHDAKKQPSIHAAPYSSPWVSGCAMLVRVAAVDQVGSFDERFFLTWEDVDWCTRMKKAGWSVRVVPSARIFHKCSRATQRLDRIRCYYAVRNSLLFARKHAGLGYWSALFFVVFNHAREALRERPEERMDVFLALWEGLQDHWNGRYGPREPRSRIGETVPVAARV
ncbi:MAG: glycosyltransferase family 2 protein [Verrucomicrobiota bacterium]